MAILPLTLTGQGFLELFLDSQLPECEIPLKSQLSPLCEIKADWMYMVVRAEH